MSELRLNAILSPAAPPVGQVTLYVKADNNLYSKDAGGTERVMAAQGQPLCIVDGTTPAFLAVNAGWTSVIRTPAGDPAGDYTVTLAAPVTGTIVAPPGISTGRIPYLLHFAGAASPITGSAEIVGGTFPFTQIRVRLKDNTFTGVDGYFTLTLMAF